MQPRFSWTSMKSIKSEDATATRTDLVAAMAAVATRGHDALRESIMDWSPIDYGLESAKPDLQSTFKKPGGDTAAG